MPTWNQFGQEFFGAMASLVDRAALEQSSVMAVGAGSIGSETIAMLDRSGSGSIAMWNLCQEVARSFNAVLLDCLGFRQVASSVEHFVNTVGIPEQVAKGFVKWWTHDLDDELRKAISPRRLEYMARNYQQGLELSIFLPPAVKAPLANLVRRLEGRAILPFELTPETLVTDGHAPSPAVRHPDRWFWLLTPTGTSAHVKGVGRYCRIDDLILNHPGGHP